MGRLYKKAEKPVEITEDVLNLFVWSINLDLNKTDPKAIAKAGFRDLNDACKFWQKNKKDFLPFLSGHQEQNIEYAVNETMRLIG